MTAPRRWSCLAGLVAGTLVVAPNVGRAQSLDWQLVSDSDRSAVAYAIAVGHEAQLPLYACRAKAGGGVQTGRYRNDFTGCHLAFGGQEISVAPFEILAPAWQESAEGAVPEGSFAGGQRVVPSPTGFYGLTTLFPCRAAYQGTTQVGEVAAGDRGCSFGFGGRQVTELRYQVLWRAPWMGWVKGIIHQLPPNAVPAGFEAGENFFICQAADKSGLHTGKIKQSSPGCSIASDGKEIVDQIFFVLVPDWVEGNAGTIPDNALPAGNERDDVIYLCRAQIRNTVQVGKITEHLAACHVGMTGSEVPSQAYEVLSAK